MKKYIKYAAALLIAAAAMTFTSVSAQDIKEYIYENIRVELERDGGDGIRVGAELSEELSGKLIAVAYDRYGTICAADTVSFSSEKNTFVLKGTDIGTVKLFMHSDDVISELTESMNVPTDAPDTLRTDRNGNLIRNDGKTVVLRGVNFGGWLLQETWMCPVLAFDDNVTVKNGTENGWANLDTLNELEKRFGKEKAAELTENYRSAYITERDFENVKEMGFNCIRIPFWYRNFMSDEDGAYITENDNDNPGFKALDFACDMADKYGLYLVLDMHGCPGGQNGSHTSGKAGRNYLYKEEKYKKIMEDLWIKIASRYKKRECIAAYDIMNEPLSDADTAHGVREEYAADPWTDTVLRSAVYDRMIKAVRSADLYHTITLEAIWRTSSLPSPSDYGWTNVMYQLHSYDSDTATTAELVNSLADVKRNYGAAAYMGEFNPLVYNGSIVKLMNGAGISYTLWNYKTAAVMSDSDWGLYHKNYTESDLKEIFGAASDKLSKSSDGTFYSMKNLTDDEILSAYESWWTKEMLSTDNFTENERLAECMQNSAAAR